MSFSKFKIPNSLIRASSEPAPGKKKLSYSARRVGAVLYAYSNALGVCKKSYKDLARLAGCSESCAVAAVKALSEAGYVSFGATYRWCRTIGGVGRGKNLYSVNLSMLRGGYTIVTRDVFRYALTDAAFVTYLAILAEIGNGKEGWPSISRLQKMTGSARSTVLAGLRVLKQLPVLLVRLCRKRNGALGHNTYKLCRLAAAPLKPQQAASIAVPAFLAPYYKARRAVCKGAKWLRARFSAFFHRGVGRNLVSYS